MGNMSREEASEVIREYVPLFRRFDELGVDYCLVGGLAVMLNAIDFIEARYRMTYDADVMLDDTFDNADMVRAYLDVYASNPDTSAAVYDATVGLAPECLFDDEDGRLGATRICGATEELDGVSTPDLDIVRFLNGKTLETLKRKTVLFEGTPIVVATAGQLLEMKQKTIGLLMASRAETSRPQDFEDIDTLRRLLEHGA